MRFIIQMFVWIHFPEWIVLMVFRTNPVFLIFSDSILTAIWVVHAVWCYPAVCNKATIDALSGDQTVKTLGWRTGPASIWQVAFTLDVTYILILILLSIIRNSVRLTSEWQLQILASFTVYFLSRFWNRAEEAGGLWSISSQASREDGCRLSPFCGRTEKGEHGVLDKLLFYLLTFCRWWSQACCISFFPLYR